MEFTLLATLGFCGLDYLLSKARIYNPYYLLHTLHNAVIVYATLPDVFSCVRDYDLLWELRHEKNWLAIELVFALHFYHIIMYFRKLRFDDWLHHGLMIGIALPIGTYLQSGPLLGFSLFFTTGLPGGIDYFLLFLTRNNWLHRHTEKYVNCWLNTWIRAPGTAAQAILTTIFILRYAETFSIDWCLGLTTAALNYWNGQYFMAQVVYDAGHHDVYKQYHLG
jgi:hypothetical protein